MAPGHGVAEVVNTDLVAGQDSPFNDPQVEIKGDEGKLFEKLLLLNFESRGSTQPPLVVIGRSLSVFN